MWVLRPAPGCMSPLTSQGTLTISLTCHSLTQVIPPLGSAHACVCITYAHSPTHTHTHTHTELAAQAHFQQEPLAPRASCPPWPRTPPCPALRLLLFTPRLESLPLGGKHIWPHQVYLQLLLRHHGDLLCGSAPSGSAIPRDYPAG